MADYKYSWANERGGGWHAKLDAQSVGEWLERLPDRRPETIVEHSRDIHSPLHNAFQWDNEKAADIYRANQACKIIGSLKVEIINKKNEPECVQAFIRTADRKQFVPMFEATEEDLTAEEKRFLKQIDNIHDRYGRLKMAQDVIDAIDRTKRLSALKAKGNLKLVG